MTDPLTGTITLPGKGDVAPQVKQKLAWRVLIGRFIARWVETFAGLAGAQIVAIIALPPDQFSFSVFLQLVGPTLMALLQAGRSAWPSIQSYLTNGFAWPDDVNTVAAG